MLYLYLFVKSTCMHWFTPACSSISQGTKRRHSSTAPFVTVGKIDLHVRFRHQWFSKNGLRPRRQFNPHDKIGRMPRGAQHPGTAQFFVDGAMVHAGRGDGAVCRKDERRKMTMAEKTIWRKKKIQRRNTKAKESEPPTKKILSQQWQCTSQHLLPFTGCKCTTGIGLYNSLGKGSVNWWVVLSHLAASKNRPKM